MLSTSKQEFKERNDSYFLTKVRHFFRYGRETRQVVGMPFDCGLELRNFSMAQTLQQVIKPLEIRSNQTVKDFFVEKFSNIEDVSPEKHSHAHPDSPLLVFVH